MLQAMFGVLKEMLPPKASFRLRTIKSDFLDRELRILQGFAKLVGGPQVHAIDVGANSGIYSAALSKYFGRVFAIEPNPDCVNYMRQVLPANCTILAAAVSDVEGRTTLRIPFVGGASETTRATISADNTFTGLAVSRTRDIDVAVHSIDGFLASNIFQVDRLGLMKIDVEGHELAVLNGAKAMLNSAQPALCIEMERRHGTQTAEAFDLLREIGYCPVRYEGGCYTIDDGQNPHQNRDAEIINQLFVTRAKLGLLGIAQARA